jgi:hypothetical protein
MHFDFSCLEFFPLIFEMYEQSFSKKIGALVSYIHDFEL